MVKDPLIFVRHILESIERIEKCLTGVSEDMFLKDQDVQDIVVHRLEIIGEAARNISEDFKRQHPDVPWKKIIGTRNILIHEYFGIDPSLIWGIMQRHLPELKAALERILKE